MSVDQHMIDWCDQHPGCKGCKFVGNECVAPEAPHKFDDWIECMSKLILKEQSK